MNFLNYAQKHGVCTIDMLYPFLLRTSHYALPV